MTRVAEENREETLKILVELAIGDDPVSCYEGSRAMRLLRSQSTADELLEIGVDPEVVKQIWPKNEEE